MPGSSRLPVSIRDTFAQRAPSKPRKLVSTGLSQLRNVLLILFLLRWTRRILLHLRGYGLLTTISQFRSYVRVAFYRLLLRLPGVSSKINAEVTKSLLKLEGKLVPSGPGIIRYTSLPKQGWCKDKVLAELSTLEDMEHTRWEEGRVSGAVYDSRQDLVDVQTRAWSTFNKANPIHPDVFPGVRKMEAEVVSMVLSLFNGPVDSAGVTTSGGTESILMACLSARNKAYAERGVTQPEMVLPNTAHAAFLKAGEYFGIKIHKVPCPGPSHKANTKMMARLINSNTCLIVGSAPNFPHGIIDDITALSRIALRYRIPLHVDCCLGSFLMPFLEKTGFATEPFDFRLKGVTSISVDTHKYGFAPKGNSTLLYRNKKLRTYQYFIATNWPGGVYPSPSIAGSRPGALIAACWASMMMLGENAYADACHSIVTARENIENAVRTDSRLKEYLSVMGKPLVSVLAFRSHIIDIYEVADGMSSRGWSLSALQDPPALHVAVTMPIVAAWKDLIEDLALTVSDVVREREERLQRGEKVKSQEEMGNATALYGVAGSLPDKSVVRDLAAGFLDTLYKT